MTALQKFIKRVRANSRIPVALLSVMLVVAGFALLTQEATRETNARKSPEMLQFEKSPDAWLANQRNVSEFIKAADGGQVATVALANGHPGLVLYTLKNGTKASVTVPGCSVIGCAGTALDKLAERSATQGFALVGVDVDPRTKSQHLLDLLGNVLSPLIIIATMGIGFFVLMGCRRAWAARRRRCRSARRSSSTTRSATTKPRPPSIASRPSCTTRRRT